MRGGGKWRRWNRREWRSKIGRPWRGSVFPFLALMVAVSHAARRRPLVECIKRQLEESRAPHITTSIRTMKVGTTPTTVWLLFLVFFVFWGVCIRTPNSPLNSFRFSLLFFSRLITKVLVRKNSGIRVSSSYRRRLRCTTNGGDQTTYCHHLFGERRTQRGWQLQIQVSAIQNFRKNTKELRYSALSINIGNSHTNQIRNGWRCQTWRGRSSETNRRRIRSYFSRFVVLQLTGRSEYCPDLRCWWKRVPATGWSPASRSRAVTGHQARFGHYCPHQCRRWGPCCRYEH